MLPLLLPGATVVVPGCGDAVAESSVGGPAVAVPGCPAGVVGCAAILGGVGPPEGPGLVKKKSQKLKQSLQI